MKNGAKYSNKQHFCNSVKIMKGFIKLQSPEKPKG